MCHIVPKSRIDCEETSGDMSCRVNMGVQALCLAVLNCQFSAFNTSMPLTKTSSDGHSLLYFEPGEIGMHVIGPPCTFRNASCAALLGKLQLTMFFFVALDHITEQ